MADTDSLKNADRVRPTMRRLVTVNWDAAVPFVGYVAAIPLTLHAFADGRFASAAALTLLCATFVRAMYRYG